MVSYDMIDEGGKKGRRRKEGRASVHALKMILSSLYCSVLPNVTIIMEVFYTYVESCVEKIPIMKKDRLSFVVERSDFCDWLARE